MQQYGGRFLNKVEFADLALPVMLAMPSIEQGLLSERQIYDMVVFSEIAEGVARKKGRQDILASTSAASRALGVAATGYALSGALNPRDPTVSELLVHCPRLVDFVGTCTRDDIHGGLSYSITKLEHADKVAQGKAI